MRDTFPEEAAKILEAEGWQRGLNYFRETGRMEKTLTNRLSMYIKKYEGSTYALTMIFDYHDLEGLRLSFNGDGEYAPVISMTETFDTLNMARSNIETCRKLMVAQFKMLAKEATKG